MRVPMLAVRDVAEAVFAPGLVLVAYLCGLGVITNWRVEVLASGLATALVLDVFFTVVSANPVAVQTADALRANSSGRMALLAIAGSIAAVLKHQHGSLWITAMMVTLIVVHWSVVMVAIRLRLRRTILAANADQQLQGRIEKWPVAGMTFQLRAFSI